MVHLQQPASNQSRLDQSRPALPIRISCCPPCPHEYPEPICSHIIPFLLLLSVFADAIHSFFLFTWCQMCPGPRSNWLFLPIANWLARSFQWIVFTDFLCHEKRCGQTAHCLKGWQFAGEQKVSVNVICQRRCWFLWSLPQRAALLYPLVAMVFADPTGYPKRVANHIFGHKKRAQTKLLERFFWKLLDLFLCQRHPEKYVGYTHLVPV